MEQDEGTARFLGIISPLPIQCHSADYWGLESHSYSCFSRHLVKAYHKHICVLHRMMVFVGMWHEVNIEVQANFKIQA